MDPKKKKKGGGSGDVVRFNVYLPREAYETLEKLRELTGNRSLAETVRAALKLYLALQEELDEGKEIVLRDKDGDTRESIRLVL